MPVLCPDYDHKRWTGWEWRYISSLLTQENGHRVMLSRFERATVTGLSEGAGFIDLDDQPPKQFADLILQRLAQVTGASPAPAKPADVPASTPLAPPARRRRFAITPGNMGR